MKKVWAPHLNRHVVIGACKLPSPHRFKIKLSSYLDMGSLPPSPTSCDYSPAAMPVISDVEGNDSVGDCVLAEEAHYIGVMTGNAGSLFSYTAAQTLAAYSLLTGYDPKNPASDQGMDPLVALNYFCKNAYADGSVNAGYAEVDMSNQAEWQFALSAFGNLKLWLGLPDAWVNNMPSANGFLWTPGQADASNGHCIGSCGYSPIGPNIMTWGLLGAMETAAASSLCTQASGGGGAVRITPDWFIKSSDKTPSGFSVQDLISDFNKFFGGHVPNPYQPIVPPAPPTPPGTVVTADMATAWLKAAFDAAHPILDRGQAEALVAATLAARWPTS